MGLRGVWVKGERFGGIQVCRMVREEEKSRKREENEKRDEIFQGFLRLCHMIVHSSVMSSFALFLRFSWNTHRATSMFGSQ